MIENNILIQHLLQRLQQFGYPPFTQLEGGLSNDAINRLLHDFAFQLPSDVRICYRYCSLVDKECLIDPWLFPGGHIFSLAEAVEFYNMYVEISAEYENYSGIDSTAYMAQWPDPYAICPSLQDDPVYDRRMLPILGDGAGGDYVVICDSVEQSVAPLYMRTASGGTFYLAFDSLTSLFATLVEALETGAYYQHELGHLLEDRTKLAPIINRHNPRRRAWFFHATRANSMAEIVRHLDHPDEDVRYYAYQALQYMYEPEAVPLLLERLDHPKAEIREQVVDLLSILEDNRAVAPLILMLDDLAPAVQLAAVNALIHLQDARAITPLLTMLHHPNDKIRERVVHGLGEFREQRAVLPLLSMLATDNNPMTRSEAARALRSIGDPQAVPALISALQDEHPQVRRSAIWALSELGGEQVIEPLRRLLTAPVSSPQADIRQEAQAAIDRIRAKQPSVKPTSPPTHL